MASNGLPPPAGGGVAESEAGSAFGSRSGSGRDHEYSGWVYHLGVNSIGHEYCHLRFLILRGRYVFMYKRDPHANPGIEPIRKGVISHTLMVEELGRRTANTEKALYVLRFYNRLDHAKKGEIACGSPADARKWMEAFEQAKQQAEFDLMRGGSRHKLNKDEINLDGHRPRVRHYAKKLVKIGKGPELLLRQTSDIGNVKMDSYSNDDDVKETHEWQCVRTVSGIRILENVGDSKGAKTFILKAVGVIQADVDTVFEVILNLDRHKRYEWDMLTCDLEQVDSLHGHYDVVYGKYEPKHLSWWNSKKDFVFSRQWFSAQDGSYTILQLPAVDKKKPPESGYKRIKINPSTWEIRQLHRNESSNAKSIVSHMVEIHPKAWERWRRNYNSKFEKSIPYALLCQVTGLREYFAANTTLTSDSPSTITEPRLSDVERSPAEFEESDIKDEFYDAIADGESLEDEDSDSDDVEVPKSGKLKLKNVSWAIASFALRRSRASIEKSELDASFPLITIDPNLFHGSMSQGKGKMGTNCWTSPSGQDFMIRGKTYLEDRSKIAGGDPLLKLIAVDWFKSENSFDKVALHPKSLVQTEAAKKLPFILIINLQIPAKPNYNLVMYYAAERPIHSKSLLEKFVDGSDVFRDARFKLIPSIVEGYWMVKRAVGTKACLLGKAVTINYLRQNNFLEIDVDIGSSSVARSIISLVLGYITSIVVDLAILIEAKEESELPEYILGTVRLNRVTLESAVPI